MATTEGDIEPVEVKEEAPPVVPAEAVPSRAGGSDQLPGESIAPSKLDMTGMEEEEKSTMAQIGDFIYNRATGRVLGRHGHSWLQIFIFYIMYYFFVFTFFVLWLIILIQSSGSLKPGITSKSTFAPVILGVSTGLSVFPTAPLTKEAQDPKERTQSYTIYYNLTSQASWEVYTKRLNKTVSEIGHYQIAGSVGGCTMANDFGYKDGKPCVLIRFNHVFDWEPESMENLESYLEKTYNDDEPARRSFTEYMNAMKSHSPYDNQATRDNFMKTHVGIKCMPDGAEQGTMGSLTYFPAPGIPVQDFKNGVAAQQNEEWLKNKTRRWDWTPYIFVQFNEPRRDVFIPVICKAFERHMNLYNSREGVGAVRFSLFILTKNK